MSNPSSNVVPQDMEKAKELIEKFGKKMNKRIAIEKIEVHFEEPKYPTGDTSLFNTSVIVTPNAGSAIIANTKNTLFLDSIQSAIYQIEKQERRSNVTRKESRRGHLKGQRISFQ